MARQIETGQQQSESDYQAALEYRAGSGLWSTVAGSHQVLILPATTTPRTTTTGSLYLIPLEFSWIAYFVCS